MSRRILLCLSHSIEETDQLRLLHGLGFEVASIGGLIDPAYPHDPKRPPLPEVPMVPVVKEAVDSLGTPDNLGAAQMRIPDAILEWLGDNGIIIYHHLLERLWAQWDRLSDWKRGSSGRRIVWRSVGQTDDRLEQTARWFRTRGLERVAYSPHEFAAPSYAGHDALIRFYADPDAWSGWVGTDALVLNVSQRLFQRGSALHPEFWVAATEGLPTMLIGEGSDEHGGLGIVPLDKMRQALRHARAYLYTGSQAAPYTLGLVEAAMTGVPIVSIGPRAWGTWYTHSPRLFEAHEMAWRWADDPDRAREHLRALLDDPALAAQASAEQRAIALDLFDMTKIGAAWGAFLS